jgi:hypothetical protein
MASPHLIGEMANTYVGSKYNMAFEEMCLGY